MLSLLAAPVAMARTRPIKVTCPTHSIDGLWCAPYFELDAIAPDITRQDLADGAFILSDVISCAEAARMVETADLMGFERPRPGDTGARRNGALSWVLHDTLANDLSRRMAPHLPQLVRVATAIDVPSPDVGLSNEDVWERQCDGAPVGLYTLQGLSARCRVYRYEANGVDAFLAHYDDVWPGSRLVQGTDDDPPLLSYDSWRYGEVDEVWAWEAGDRVSQLSVLLCARAQLSISSIKPGHAVLINHPRVLLSSTQI